MMRRQLSFGVVALVLTGSLVATGAEKPSAGYSRAMTDLGLIEQGIDKVVKSEDYATLAKYAESATAAFQVVDDYWKERTGEQYNDAREAVRVGSRAAFDLGIAAGLKNAEGATYSAKELMSVCAGCHLAHRQELPDKTFQIN